MRSFALLIAALVGLAAMPASAREYKAGTLTITDPWSRATPKGASVGAGYLKIVNTGTTADRLVRTLRTISESRFPTLRRSDSGRGIPVGREPA